MLTKDMVAKINNIIALAETEGRNSLFEHEVYDVLKLLGLKVPEYVFVQDPLLLDKEVLHRFGQSLVIKIVSPQIAHKQKIGGVKIIHNTELAHVKDALQDMKQRVLSHYKDDKPDIKGFLLVEFIQFNQSLGYEVLFGFKQDAAFGPVLTISKGGDDAEFFAKYYDPANLILPPIDMDTAKKKVVGNLNIRHKFETSGHPGYLSDLGMVISALSELAYAFSSIAEEKPEYVISSMDINPFVLAEDGRFVAVDGFAEFETIDADNRCLPAINVDNIDRFFHPRGIAVIGVSADMGKYSLGREIGFLLHNCKREDVYFVNAKGGCVVFENKEYLLYKSIRDISAKIDLVVYAAPARLTLEFIKELHDISVKAVILISGIPSDIKYSDFKADLDSVVPKGLRIIGPNCMGVFYAPDAENKGLNTLFIDEKRLEVKSSDLSNTALLTQSGALALTVIDRFNNSRMLKAVISFGNKYDVNAMDLIAHFAKEDTIDVIAIYLEGLDAGEGRMFFEQVKLVTKPVIVYKSGKTEAGARAAASHTASMSGSYDVFKTACRQAGVILTERNEDFEDTVKIFSLMAHKKPAGNRIAGVFNAGFESTLGADELGNLKQALLSEHTLQKLKNADRNGLVDYSTSFLDITPMADDSMYADFVEALLQDENVDCVFVAIIPYAPALKSLPENCRDTDGLASLISDLSKKYDKPIIVSVNAGVKYLEFSSVMEENGLPVYSNVRSAIRSLDQFVLYNMEEI